MEQPEEGDASVPAEPEEPGSSAEPEEPDASVEPEEPTDAADQGEKADSGEAEAGQSLTRELGLIPLEEEVTPPDFTLPTLEGSDITLSELQGTYVLVNFWSTHCPPCVAEMGYFEAVGSEHSEELEILAVDVQESVSTVREFLGGGETSFTVALDEGARVARSYGIRYTPTTIFIDAKGHAPYVKIGAFRSQEQLERSVALLLGE
ncbi:MAG: redoxin domain-containing protein [Chloroflexota bacterium]